MFLILKAVAYIIYKFYSQIIINFIIDLLFRATTFIFIGLQNLPLEKKSQFQILIFPVMYVTPEKSSVALAGLLYESGKNNKTLECECFNRI